ncbi:hypothetical protein [Tardiphaga robiniae]|uniref:Uncharacterized protein n=1 Tax=Tardiphaga robiniae TaxID=943830 RepID=A0A163XU28_9BRAD|nr:hypothetical protein [Tardiphaga robiniae]KZD21366.1 hypothetical protein A4A58_13355 [Tardiphaga robiniae]
MNDDLRRLLDDLTLQIGQTKEQNIAIQGVCAALVAEIALLDKAPREKLSRMVAGLQGAALGVADGTDGRSTEMTKTIERVTAMAEAMLQPRK